jgi:predicted RNA-binding protein YlqC (UPF0109 family)
MQARVALSSMIVVEQYDLGQNIGKRGRRK